MNKQPFYHRAVVLFTATREISEDEFNTILGKLVSNLPKYVRDTGILASSMLVEEIDNEPGDPADLM